MFVPNCDKYPFPEDTSHHYLVVKKNNGTVFDENYPYIDNSKKAKRSKWWTRLLLNIIVFPMANIYLGLRIKNKKNLKKHKEEIDKGMISVSNHIHLWDYISVMKAMRKWRYNVIVWAPNIRGENGKMMRDVGGIPIPENDVHATIAFNESLKNLLDNGGHLHIYPEGSMWEYYTPIRPFKKGAAYFACTYNKPILPMGFSYRKPSLLRKFILRQPAALTLTIGEPLYPNVNMSKAEQEIDLILRAHKAVCELSGIDPSKNIYEPIYSNSKKKAFR